MKKEIPQNEKILSKEDVEFTKILSDDFYSRFGDTFPTDFRLDHDDYPLSLKIFVAEGMDFCKAQQFNLSDVLQITKLNKSQFRQWLNREQITLYTATKQGSGKHLKYSVVDILIIKLAISLSNIRAPIPLANQIKGTVLNRLKSVVERTQKPGIHRIQLNFLTGFQKWKATESFSEESPDDDINRPAFIVLNVDRLIYECLDSIDGFFFNKELNKSPNLKKYMAPESRNEADLSLAEKEIKNSSYLDTIMSLSGDSDKPAG